MPLFKNVNDRNHVKVWITNKSGEFQFSNHMRTFLFLIILSAWTIMSCKNQDNHPDHTNHANHSAHADHDHSHHELPVSPKGHNAVIKKYLDEIELIPIDSTEMSRTDYMSLIKGGTYDMGAEGEAAVQDEFPKHKVTVDSFWIDITEVTNEDFTAFTSATGYLTTAERELDVNEILAQLPPGYELPPDFDTSPMSLVFEAVKKGKPASPNTWWKPVADASWRHPQGPESSASDKPNHPAVHLSWFDAMAYCRWKGKRLPTESEWEYAARGRLTNQIYPWGNDPISPQRANYWQGEFPYENLNKDGHISTAPVRSYEANAHGLYDMAGNVWEWCSDWYKNDHYREKVATQDLNNPTGPDISFDPDEPTIPKKVIRGGSFLCNDSYCSGYRVSARMKSSPDTGLEHTGCRCARSVE